MTDSKDPITDGLYLLRLIKVDGSISEATRLAVKEECFEVHEQLLLNNPNQFKTVQIVDYPYLPDSKVLDELDIM